MRHDYLIDNTIGYFRDTFMKKTKQLTELQIKKLNLDSDLFSLLPAEPLRVGEDAALIKPLREHIETTPIVNNFDDIL